ncbi:MAG: XdhC family protein [Pyrinomonadaceae bacterium]
MRRSFAESGNPHLKSLSTVPAPMPSETALWRFIEIRLRASESVVVLIAAESHGSSPGRAGYKMAVAANGEMVGSIGGGVMEVRLADDALAALSKRGGAATGFRTPFLTEQVHQKNSLDASGMICSGRQTVISVVFTPADLPAVRTIVEAIDAGTDLHLSLTAGGISVGPAEVGIQGTVRFERWEGDGFTYSEALDRRDQLYIVGGGHCSLALSEIMSRLDFRVSVFDDRPQINTIGANRFADEIAIIDGYDDIRQAIPQGDQVYVAVMTIGYEFDAVVIRQLLDHDLRYFGVLGSRAKMATLMKQLRAEGHPPETLSLIHTPIGLPINSRTPQEIAISIAAEIISVRNA